MKPIQKRMTAGQAAREAKRYGLVVVSNKWSGSVRKWKGGVGKDARVATFTPDNAYSEDGWFVLCDATPGE